MALLFDPRQNLVIVRALVEGVRKPVVAHLALDTGATTTLLNADILEEAGYLPVGTSPRLRITTGSGVEYAPLVTLTSLRAIEQQRTQFPVACHTLPPTAHVDGLLGLDFLRGRKLTVDFRRGTITLA